MELKAYPGYEYNLNLYRILAEGTEEEKAAAREAQRKYISGYTRPEGTRMEDIIIAGGEIGGDAKRIALHGTSAGANLCARLALYVRDHTGPDLSLVILNCPPLSLENTCSRRQYPQFALSAGGKRDSAEMIYLGDQNGAAPSYYAFPGYCTDLELLPPHYIIVGEYDTLRDDGLRYAMRLMESGVPCELQVAPRVGHGFCVVDHPLTHWVHKGCCASLRREFGMEIVEF